MYKNLHYGLSTSKKTEPPQNKNPEYYCFATLYDGKIEGNKESVSNRLEELIKNSHNNILRETSNPAGLNSHETPRARLTYLAYNLSTLNGFRYLSTLKNYGSINHETKKILDDCIGWGYYLNK
ncbi:MAG: hypothetical protein ACQESF_06700 [Nanobdellota archaeon]